MLTKSLHLAPYAACVAFADCAERSHGSAGSAAGEQPETQPARLVSTPCQRCIVCCICLLVDGLLFFGVAVPWLRVCWAGSHTSTMFMVACGCMCACRCRRQLAAPWLAAGLSREPEGRESAALPAAQQPVTLRLVALKLSQPCRQTGDTQLGGCLLAFVCVCSCALVLDMRPCVLLTAGEQAQGLPS